ncbi:hypothetical protein Tsp_05155 [Trichinella spiralis]|uniref:hypothetical protein n=1 Tax=Trichinella spiralis TaxID=6334 RepID=UPI0001EFD3C6|nr:hypothetical protein Tsp_05155 [Trichinella spiralis]
MWPMFVCFMESGIKLVKKGVNPKDKYGMLHDCLPVLSDLLDACLRVTINWICDAEIALKDLLCAGRSGEERQIGLASTNVGQLAQPHGLTSVGTISAYRRDVPACLRKAARRDLYSTFAVYEHNRKITMINYVPRIK